MNEDMVLGFDHIHVNAPPEAQENARWFYGTVLGLKEVAVPHTIISDSAPMWFELGDGQQLHVTFEPVSRNAVSSGHLALRVRSVAALLEVLGANGFDSCADLAAGAGEARCFCRDPFGNRLEFVEYASAKVCGTV
jgi:catechol 2,3-dioxygenase-like lactoylglutathione lyase family enzyme